MRYRATIRAKVEKRVRINGHWVMRPVWVTRTVWKTKQAPVQTTVAGPPAPCYPSGDVSGDYGNYAYAIWVLAHESIHLYDMRSGGSVDLPFEIRADCYGLQWVRYAAQQLGDTADDGEAIAQYDFNVQYPTHQGITNGGGQPYWSADCHQGGPLDLSPSDGVWP